MNQSRVPILTYHSIDDSGSIISTAPDKFRAQMRTLRERQFHVISLHNLVNRIRRSQPLPAKTVVITFDDGFSNFSQEAYPVLREFGFSATVFLVPGYVGKASEWNEKLKGMPVLDLLNWDQILEMVHNGVELGAHAMTHSDLTNLPFEQVRREIIDSKLEIEKRVGKEVLFFSYPYGSLNKEIKGIVRGEFYGACTTSMNFVTEESDIYHLPRIDMFYFSNNSLFRYVGTFVFSFYILLRSALRTIRIPANFCKT